MKKMGCWTPHFLFEEIIILEVFGDFVKITFKNIAKTI